MGLGSASHLGEFDAGSICPDCYGPLAQLGTAQRCSRLWQIAGALLLT